MKTQLIRKEQRKVILRNSFKRWEILESDGICFFKTYSFWREGSWEDGSSRSSIEELTDQFSERITLDYVIKDLTEIGYILVNDQTLYY